MSKTEIRRIATKILPTTYLEPREYLAALYQALKAQIVAYSYIRFTEDLGFGACNAMYLIVHGNRPLTTKGAQKIVTALGLTGVERKYFLQLVAAQREGDPTEREAVFERLVSLKSQVLPRTLDRSQLEFYNHWYNAAILELLSLKGAKDDPAWISTHLHPSVPPEKVGKSLALLKKLGHLVYNEAQGRLVPSQADLSTGAEVFGLAVMRYHQQMIALAKDALTDVAPLDRDISAVTIAIPADRMGELKEKIRLFRRELLQFSSETEGHDEITQINIQLFPIGRISPRNRRNET